MRSDERSGAVFIALMFLWGTLLAEPLHIYTHYIRKTVDACAMFFGVENTSSAGVSIAVCIVFVALGVVLLKLSDTTFAPFLGSLLLLISAIAYIINSIIDHNMTLVTVIVFVIFGRDEEGLTRFQRRQIRKMQKQVSAQDTNATIKPDFSLASKSS